MIGRADAVHLLSQQAPIVGEGLLDDRLIGETEDHRDVAGIHLIDQLNHAALGIVESRRLDVLGRHAGRRIDQENRAIPEAGFPSPSRPQTGQDHEQDDQQLQKQKQALPQTLPNRVDVQVLDRAAPQVRAGDFDRLTLELQEVEEQDRGGHRG